MAAYELSEAALNDLDRLYEYGLETFGIVQADAYYDGLVARLGEIAETPHRFPAADHAAPGYRFSVYGANSIYYRVTDAGVYIVRILGRQDWAE